MAEYRLYCLNDHGGFSRAREIEADTDEDAVAIARDLKLPVKCEIWQRSRKVAVLDAHSTA